MSVAMSSSLSGSACFNPRFIGEERPKENHAPVVTVFPPPSNEPLEASIGEPCAPITLSIVSLDDADGDPLTVRFDMLRTLGGTRDKRQNIDESEPIRPGTDGSYPLTNLTSLVLDQNTVGGINPGDVDTQLIELRVADSGFESDGNGLPVAGAGGGLFFISWMVRIAACPVGE